MGDMAEPTSTAGLSLTAFAVALLGPLAGPYTAIIFAALAGSLWPLSSTEGLTRAAGAWLLLRCVLTATVLTSTAAAILSAEYGIEPTELLSPVAFFLGALGNGWKPVLSALSGVLSNLAGKLGSKQP